MRRGFLCILALGGGAALLFPIAVKAQSGGGNPSRAVCMVRAAENGNEFAIIVPRKDVRGMRAKAFKRRGCRKVFASRSRMESYRGAVCAIAAVPNAEVQVKYAERYGERPASLCGMAETAIGQWENRAERKKKRRARAADQ